MKIVALTSIGVFAFVFLALVSYSAYAFYIKTWGITLKPGRTYEPVGVMYFLQNDDLWKHEKMGESGYTLGSSGCLISSICSVLQFMGISTHPKDLNSAFSKNNVYNPGGEIIWMNISAVFPDITYDFSRVFGSTTIEAYLRAKQLPLVKVKYHKNGAFHWVVIVGAEENNFIIMDPLYKEKKPLNLSIHGKVYAYRILSRNL